MPTLTVQLPDLRRDQWTLFQAFTRWNVWVCHRRFGKCLDVETPIPLWAGGYKPLSALVAGDVLFDEGGQPTTVLAAYDPKEGLPCYEVVFSDGARIVCDSEHLWHTETKLDRAARLRTAGARQEYGACGRAQPKHGTVKTTQALYETLRYQGESNHSIPCAAPLEYAKTFLPLPAYILGTWLGDGHSRDAALTTMDTEIVEAWQAYALSTQLRFAPIQAQNAGQATTYRLTGRDGWFRQQLRALGVLGAKHIPAAYLYGSVEDRLALLRGLMDTDGSVVAGTSHCEFAQKSPQLVAQFSTLLSTLGVKHTVSQHQRALPDTYYRVTFSPTFCPFALARKVVAFRPGGRSPARRYIVDIVPVPSRPVRCIAVDSPSHLFLCGKEMIPTHNTMLCLYLLLREAFRNTQARPRYAYVAPLYRQAKAIAWDTLKYFVQYIPDAKVNEQELRVDFAQNGARIQLLGADSPDTLRGLYLDGAVLDEYAQMQPRAWREVIRPALADRTGWAIWIGTPNGRNHFYDVAMRAQERQATGDANYSYRIFRASETGILSAAELASARETMQDFEYQQEFECSWTAPVPGSYYQEEFAAIERQGRIRPLVYDPYYPTCTAWDLGINDTNAIWYFQPKGQEIHFIDYDEGNSLPLAPPDYPQPGANLDNNWLAIVRSKPYIYDYSRLAEPQSREPYERHFGPHDLEQTEYGSGKTRYGIALHHPMERYRLRFTVIPRGPIQDGIAAARRLLSRSVFSEERCARGLDALRAYRREWNETSQAFADHPYHSWASNGSDAFRTAAIGIEGEGAAPQPALPGNSFLWAREQAKRARSGRPLRTFRL